MEKTKKIIVVVLFYYSLIMSILLVAGGFITARTGQEYINALLLVPMLIFIILNFKNFYKIK